MLQLHFLQFSPYLVHVCSLDTSVSMSGVSRHEQLLRSTQRPMDKAQTGLVFLYLPTPELRPRDVLSPEST